tara:strand:+ start:227 stop:514 length:288 start_codon:yes stop_codon:yes gene_type:complete
MGKIKKPILISFLVALSFSIFGSESAKANRGTFKEVYKFGNCRLIKREWPAGRIFYEIYGENYRADFVQTKKMGKSLMKRSGQCKNKKNKKNKKK